MSAEVETMFYTRVALWHGLGTCVENALGSQAALKVAGLDWKVVQKPIFTEEGQLVGGFKANIRDRDNQIQGVVTDRYKVVQNEEVFAFTDQLLGEGVTYETVGSLQGGRRTWILAKNTIRKYQENPEILADFMGNFCRFLCTKASDSEYWKEKVLIWEELWERNKGYFYGSNQSRFAQTMTALQLAARVIRDFSEYCHADETFDVEGFIQTADKIALKLMSITQLKVGGDILLLQDAFSEIVNNGEFNIFLSPKVITEYPSRWSNLPYGLLEGVNALWIADVNRINNRAEANFDWTPHIDPNKGKDREPVCIVRLDWLTRLLQQKIQELKKRYNYKAMIQIINTKLRDAGIICGTMRNDKTYNMQFKCPYIYRDNIVPNIVLETVGCVCLNLSNPLLNTMVKDLQQKDTDEQEIYVDDYKMWNNLMYFNNYDELNRQLRKSLDYLKNKS